MKKSVRIISLLLAIIMIFVQAGCDLDALMDKPYPSQSQSDTSGTKAFLNGVDIQEYTIVYDEEALDYTERAAKYIREQIEERVGVKLDIVTDSDAASAHEIVVGETNRTISTALNANTSNLQFAILAQNGSVALEGDTFVIAAAAYYFVENYISGKIFSTAVPSTATICEPIAKAPKNFIMLIGDGMGVNQTKLFDKLDSSTVTYSDNEDIFYGYMFPALGFCRTKSLSGVTDSAAAGTALATGFKTINTYIGRNKKLNDLVSLTEIAGSLGMATAVMSTEAQTGATPSAFSAHADNRSDTTVIQNSQLALQSQYGTIIKCGYDGYTIGNINMIENYINETLETLSENEKGFFMMYEEAYIDKYCEKNDLDNTFKTVTRFNQAIAVFMEYAFYNPETFILITADHETGGLHLDSKGNYTYQYTGHTGEDVPVFAYGVGSEVFNGKTIENVQIPKTIAAMWGEEIVGDSDSPQPSLIAIN